MATRCDAPNWGENADWCVLHQQEPLLCVSLAREALEMENRELRNAARIGAKNIRVWLQEGCDCDAEAHVCGIKDVKKDLEFIERTVQKDPLPGSPDRITVREACRRRLPLGGTDAQALEHGMTQLEQEKAAIQKQYEDSIRLSGEMRNEIALLMEYIHATEFWQIEPHDQKERMAHLARIQKAGLALKRFTSENRPQPEKKCTVCGDSAHSGRCGEQGGSGPEDGYA